MFISANPICSSEPSDSTESPSQERERRYRKRLLHEQRVLAGQHELPLEEFRAAALLQARISAGQEAAAANRARRQAEGRAQAPDDSKDRQAREPELTDWLGELQQAPQPVPRPAMLKAEQLPKPKSAWAKPEGMAVRQDPARELRQCLQAGLDRLLADVESLPGEETPACLQEVLARLRQLDIAGPRQWLREVRQNEGAPAWAAQRERMEGSVEFFRAFCGALPDGTPGKADLLEQLARILASLLGAGQEPEPSATAAGTAQAAGTETEHAAPDRNGQVAAETGLRDYLQALAELAQSLAVVGPGVPPVLHSLGQFRQHLRGKEAPESVLARLSEADHAAGGVFRADIGAALGRLKQAWAALPPDHAAKALLKKKSGCRVRTL